MLESLRARLLLWYSSILALVILAFGAAVCYLYWRSLLTGLDTDLNERATGIAQALRLVPSGTFDLDLPEESAASFRARPGARRYYAIWNANGELIDRSDPDLEIPILTAAATRNRAGVREIGVSADGGAVVLVGQETSELVGAVRSLAGTVAAAGAAALGLSFVGGWFLASRALGPIARISRTAKAMSEGDFAARIAIDRTETELGQVAVALNGAFDRLHLAVDQQRRFTADASHELRTPLSILSAEVEWALARPRGVAEYQTSLEACSRAAARMRRVAEGLLTLARADAGELALRRVPVPLDQVTHEVVTSMQPLAEKRRLSVTMMSDSQDLLVSGDPDRLREVVTNLVSNAIHYNRDEGRIEIKLRKDGGSVCLEIADTGIGIAPEDLPRVFDRFYRVDQARSQETGGSGLGLAVTKWIVDRHGGEITCASEVGRGTRVAVRLPAASSPGL